jgi:plasmid stabilization system protein ParE
LTQSARFSQQARREIAQVLAGMQHVAAQKALRVAVETSARRLGINPFMGRIAPPYVPAPYRFWSLTRFGYVMVYDPATDPVEILRFVHTRRDLPRVLADLTDRTNDGEEG